MKIYVKNLVYDFKEIYKFLKIHKHFRAYIGCIDRELGSLEPEGIGW